MSTIRTSLPTAAFVLLAASLSAQDKPQPPKILRIVEENVKAYKGAAHEKISSRLSAPNFHPVSGPELVSFFRHAAGLSAVPTIATTIPR